MILIISHWDVDHYNLLCAADDTLLKRISAVIVPDYVDTQTAEKAIKRLKDNHVTLGVIFSPLRSKRKVQIKRIQCNNNYHFYIGEKAKNKNLSGLMLSLIRDKNVVFFTGDHKNYQVWKMQYEQLADIDRRKTLNVIVPHHGGNNGKIGLHYGNNGKAVISTGKNYYGHPSDDTIKKYTDYSFQVERTYESLDNYIIIYLSL